VLLFTYVFGGAIAGSTGEYLTYALPGIIVMNMLFVTMYVGTGLNTDLTKGVFDRLRSLPIARWAPMAGRIIADQVKQAWSIFLLLAVGMILGFRIGTNVVSLMPGWLQTFVNVNPISILADACRGLMLTGAEATPIIQSLVWAAAIAAVFAPLSVWAFKRRV
jgi:oleandomycin transport system permease protein